MAQTRSSNPKIAKIQDELPAIRKKLQEIERKLRPMNILAATGAATAIRSIDDIERSIEYSIKYGSVR